ncbi:pyruvate dehydrogenase complex transcriptional repressor PdhR [Vibrio breoganii]|uniref:Pyruvate dehydrogenase complex repressor n=2 Tax=Vibrio TaxID=662 RepID=A0AAP8MY42_9VIBR|nr:pyruvate dehydrogenase complex transcriptional repressor PdhR [Vibrio breoganii]MDN3717153.1 pyruvate dehydrogenase complex transcriptional repressor PdhR [Vibrio breoganii]NMO71907.1 pyruvate dehydrogenase complex transcriptional repressor PdhR [Vibrio breoganii]NMR68445.1 pyruvate dehydrogenase complex transcriptional repressor PdhR [Vibrio breoganii]OCH73139.1 transcriptional regulator PdhR [Vibrio breoganii]PMF85258.1 transcriptional regulator PdhR [Vibrio breoganii]
MQKVSFQSIRQPKLSDVIERELETLILDGILSPGQQLPPERELAKQFDVSRPSVREAIQRLEAKGLLTRRQGGGTFVCESLSSNLTDPLLNLLSNHADTQRDLLETRHALEGISAYFAALRGTTEDFQRITQCQKAMSVTVDSDDVEQESEAIMDFLIAIAEASHNVVLLHIVRSLSPLLQKNVSQNLMLLHSREDVIQKLNEHRADIVKAITSREPQRAREMSETHLAFIDETLSDLTEEQGRRARSLRRIQQNKQ